MPLKIYFSVRKTNVREIRFSNVRNSPKRPLRRISLRLKIERKPLRSEIERTVRCTMAEQSDDKKGYRYRKITEGKKRQRFHPKRSSPLPPSWMHQILPKTYRMNQSRYLSNTSGSLTLSGKPALKRELTPDLTLSPSLASSLDDWITKRLSKGHYLGSNILL